MIIKSNGTISPDNQVHEFSQIGMAQFRTPKTKMMPRRIAIFKNSPNTAPIIERVWEVNNTQRVHVAIV